MSEQLCKCGHPLSDHPVELGLGFTGVCWHKHEAEDGIMEYDCGCKKFEPAPEPQMVSDCCKAEIFSEMDRSIAWDTKEGYTNEVFCSKCGNPCVPHELKETNREFLKRPVEERQKILAERVKQFRDTDGCMSGEASCEPVFDYLVREEKKKAWQEGFDAAHKVPTVEEIKEVVYDNSLCKYNCEFWDKAGAYCYAEPKDHCALATAIHNLWEVSND